MKRIRIILLIVSALSGVVLAWCKLDGVEVICAQYRPQQELAVGRLRAYPYLMPDTTSRGTGGFFKYRVIWHGPHTFRISFRDFGKTYEKVRLLSVRLSTTDGTWAKDLVIHPQFSDWQPLEKQRWTDKFNETCFFAVGDPDQNRDWVRKDITLPTNGVFNADIQFKVAGMGQEQEIRKTVILKLRPRKTYMSSVVADAISH